MNNSDIAASNKLLEQLVEACQQGTVLGAPIAPIGLPARELVADAEGEGSDE